MQPPEQGPPTPPPVKCRAGSVGDRTGDKKSRVSSTWERGRGAPQSPKYLLYVPNKVPSILMSDTERPHQSGRERGQSRRAKAFPSAHPRALEREGRTNRGTRAPSGSLGRGRQRDGICAESETKELMWAELSHGEEAEFPRTSRRGNAEKVWLKEVPNKLLIIVFFFLSHITYTGS